VGQTERCIDLAKAGETRWHEPEQREDESGLSERPLSASEFLQALLHISKCIVQFDIEMEKVLFNRFWL
jgi:hypothetical protein